MTEYIEREAALSLVRPDTPEDEKYVVTIATAKKLVRSIVCRTPAADVTPVVHGEWLLRHEGYGHYWECSSCHKNPCIYVTKDTRYCPNCGAKMDEKDEDDAG